MRAPQCPNCKTTAFIWGGRIAHMQYWFCDKGRLGCGWSTEIDVRPEHERNEAREYRKTEAP